MQRLPVLCQLVYKNMGASHILPIHLMAFPYFCLLTKLPVLCQLVSILMCVVCCSFLAFLIFNVNISILPIYFASFTWHLLFWLNNLRAFIMLAAANLILWCSQSTCLLFHCLVRLQWCKDEYIFELWISEKIQFTACMPNLLQLFILFSMNCIECKHDLVLPY